MHMRRPLFRVSRAAWNRGYIVSSTMSAITVSLVGTSKKRVARCMAGTANVRKTCYHQWRNYSNEAEEALASCTLLNFKCNVTHLTSF